MSVRRTQLLAESNDVTILNKILCYFHFVKYKYSPQHSVLKRLLPHACLLLKFLFCVLFMNRLIISVTLDFASVFEIKGFPRQNILGNTVFD
jgi:hypothetical protein